MDALNSQCININGALRKKKHKKRKRKSSKKGQINVDNSEYDQSPLGANLDPDQFNFESSDREENSEYCLPPPPSHMDLAAKVNSSDSNLQATDGDPTASQVNSYDSNPQATDGDSTTSQDKSAQTIVSLLSESDDDDNLDIPQSKRTPTPTTPETPRRGRGRPRGPFRSSTTTRQKSCINVIPKSRMGQASDDDSDRDSPGNDDNQRPTNSTSSRADTYLQMVKYSALNSGLEVDEKMVSRILSSCLVNIERTSWGSLGGLRRVKPHLEEAVITPLMNPNIFKGLRTPGKGLLLFGPPGTGKTMIGKCIATEARAKFLCVSGAAFASKWFGEAERLACSLFLVARSLAPSIIFLDEADSFLSQRKDSDGGITNRLKNLLLQEMDGAATNSSEAVMVIAATNRPHLIDEAARRRFTRRVYVPLPDKEDREAILRSILRNEKIILSPNEWTELATLSDGFSAADLKVACSNAAMEPIRELGSVARTATVDQVRGINFSDMKFALTSTPRSVSKDDLKELEKFNEKFGAKDICTRYNYD